MKGAESVSIGAGFGISTRALATLVAELTSVHGTDSRERLKPALERYRTPPGSLLTLDRTIEIYHSAWPFDADEAEATVRLIVFTQAVDLDNPVLGFFLGTPWPLHDALAWI